MDAVKGDLDYDTGRTTTPRGLDGVVSPGGLSSITVRRLIPEHLAGVAVVVIARRAPG